MLLSALKKRWPILTTGVAGLLWLVNNYNIRGLDGLRLEPRAGAPTQDLGYGSSPFGMPASYTPGPALPGTLPTSGLDAGSAFPNQLGNNPLNASSPGYAAQGYSAQGYAAGYPTGAGASAAGANGYGANGFGAGGVGSNLTLPGAALPGTALPGTALPGTSLPGATAGGGPSSLPLPGNLSLDVLRPAVKALGGQDWDQLLSVGEKLGMLERTRQAVPSPAPVYQTRTAAMGQPPAAATMQPRDTIRIASFNLSGWGDANQDRPAVTEMLVKLMGQFDVIALQDIRSRRDDLLPNLMIQLNRGGRAFDFMIGPRIGRGDVREQLAFVFDTDRIETDRFQLYTVADPEDIIAREPLVGWFRTKQANDREAFTFSLVNMHIDSNLASSELGALPSLVEAIYNDGRGEDDIILAGDFSEAGPQSAFFTSGLFRSAIDGVATNTRGTHLIDNIAMPVMGSTEFMGRAGAVDFLRQYNLTLEQALSVSEHLPIWAEFSIIEGGRPGQVAGNLMPERNFHTGQTN